MVGVYLVQGSGGSLSSGLSPVGSGCRRLTFGGSSLVSPCVFCGGPWLACRGRFLWHAASMGQRLCIAGLLWRVRWATGAWIVAVPPVGFTMVRRAHSSVGPLGTSLLRCAGGGIGLDGSFGGCGTCRVVMAGGGRAASVCGRCLHCVVRLSGLLCPGVSALPHVRGSLPSSFLPLPTPSSLFFFFVWGTVVACTLSWGGAGAGGVCGSKWPLVIAALGEGVSACRCRCWRGHCGAVGQFWSRGFGRGCRGGWWFGGCCASGSPCVCRPPDIRWLLVGRAPVNGCRRWVVGSSGGVVPV